MVLINMYTFYLNKDRSLEIRWAGAVSTGSLRTVLNNIKKDDAWDGDGRLSPKMIVCPVSYRFLF